MRAFTSILADPNTDNRAIFKTAVRALPEFGEIYMAGKLDEVRQVIEQTRKPWDLVFVSYRIKPEDVSSFLGVFRDTPAASETAVIQIFKMGEASNTKVATTIAQGFNGILCEPFSGDGLKICAKQAVGLRLNGTKERIKIALAVIIPVVARNAAKTGGKLETLLTKEHKELTESCKVLRELAEYCGSTYDIIINEVFDDLKKGVRDEYSGVSKRLKDKFALEGNVQDQLREELLKIR